jgi:hypothetical protein
MIVLLTPMVPQPGEKPRDWWGNTGYRGAAGLSEKQQGTVALSHHQDYLPQGFLRDPLAVVRQRAQIG